MSTNEENGAPEPSRELERDVEGQRDVDKDNVYHSAEVELDSRKLDDQTGKLPEPPKFWEKTRLPFSDDPHPWDQMVGESNLWYSRFCFYLSLGPERSFRAARIAYYEQHGKDDPKEQSSKAYWNNYGVKHNWRKRASSFDLAIAEHLKANYANDLIETRNRHRRQAMLLQSLAMRKFKKIREQLTGDDGEEHIEELSTAEALKLLTEGVKQELLSLEQPEIIIGAKDKGSDGSIQAKPVRAGEKVDLSELSIPELETLSSLIGKAGGSISISALGARVVEAREQEQEEGQDETKRIEHHERNGDSEEAK